MSYPVVHDAIGRGALRERGWSPGEIKRVLGEPLYGTHPGRRVPQLLWPMDRVRAAEESPEHAAWIAGRDQRRIGSVPAVSARPARYTTDPYGCGCDYANPCSCECPCCDPDLDGDSCYCGCEALDADAQSAHGAWIRCSDCQQHEPAVART